MTTTEQILVIYLSIALAVFLTLGIILMIQGIRISKSVQRIVDKAEHVVQSAEHVGQVLSNVSGPLGILQILRNLGGIATKDKKRGK
jgi:uncharacterized membrane protein